MEYITIVAVTVYIMLFSLMVGLIIISIIFNIKAGIKYRQNLAKRLDTLRLGKMIKALGIDTSQYLHEERIHDINIQLKRCNECENTAECDDNLVSGSMSAKDIPYCINEQGLQKIAVKQKQ